MPIPKGIKLNIYRILTTYSADAELGKAQTTGDEKGIKIYVEDKVENTPDLFFKLFTNYKHIRLDTNELVDSVDIPSKFSFIVLPASISIKGKKGYIDEGDKKKELPGLLKSYGGCGEGTADKPWVIQLEDIQIVAKMNLFQFDKDATKPMYNNLILASHDNSIDAAGDHISGPDDWKKLGCDWIPGVVPPI